MPLNADLLRASWQSWLTYDQRHRGPYWLIHVLFNTLATWNV